MHKVTEMLQMIRAALGEDADEVSRRRAANACDELLVALGGDGGAATRTGDKVDATMMPTTKPAATPPPVSPASQMLDALIAKLQSELTSRDEPTDTPAARELRIPFVPIPGPTAGGQ